ncbi:hypothetical protein [Streptomyces sp. NPDC026666]|uniref:hypothetical protein n=1 Tax=Streptomyces sp. NPDC026666 TaxID=3154799 RepID=UPI003454D793
MTAAAVSAEALKEWIRDGIARLRRGGRIGVIRAPVRLVWTVVGTDELECVDDDLRGWVDCSTVPRERVPMVGPGDLCYVDEAKDLVRRGRVARTHGVRPMTALVTAAAARPAFRVDDAGPFRSPIKV